MWGWVFSMIVMYVKIIAILDPFAVMPVFITLTEGLDTRRKDEIVWKAFIAMCVMVTIFTLFGVWILNIFGISLASLRVGGGAILLVLAFDILGEAPRSKKLDPEEIAVMPIATPLLVGPGTMTTIILLVTENNTLEGYIAVLTASLLAVTTAALMLKYSTHIIAKLSKSFVRGLGRFMTIIIAATAFEMIKNGIIEWVAMLK
ncbi:MAG: MarC family protein [Desulfurococcaceae archaeon TW002]